MDERLNPSATSQAERVNKNNRRLHRRTHLRVKADVTLPGDLTIVGHTLDISAGGLSIEVPYDIELGQRCEIELNLSRLGGPRWVQVVGEVRRCVQADDDTYMAGLQFVDLDPKIKLLIDECIWSRITPAPADADSQTGDH